MFISMDKCKLDKRFTAKKKTKLSMFIYHITLVLNCIDSIDTSWIPFLCVCYHNHRIRAL